MKNAKSSSGYFSKKRVIYSLQGTFSWRRLVSRRKGTNWVAVALPHCRSTQHEPIIKTNPDRRLLNRY
jgi:hypothetical protein